MVAICRPDAIRIYADALTQKAGLSQSRKYIKIILERLQKMQAENSACINFVFG